MRRHYQTRRALAIVAGLVATIGALAILLAEPISTGEWRLDHLMVPVLVTVVILAGHLFSDAVRARKPLHAIGFAIAFTAGSSLTIYSSIGAQKASSGDRAADVETHNAQVKAKTADIAAERQNLAVARDMLANVTAKHVEESRRGGCKASCQGIERSITVYRASITGHETTIARLEGELSRLGGERAARPKAQALADLLAVFGYDRAKVEAVAGVLEAPAYSLTLEIMAIAAFGFGFRRRKEPDGPASGKPDRPARPDDPAGGPDRPGTNVVALRPAAIPTRIERSEALADLRSMLKGGLSVPSQQALADRWGRPKQTVSDWLRDWEASGRIPRRTVSGRAKAVG